MKKASLCLLSLCTIISCSKKSDPSPPTDVYVIGIDNANPAYWKNGNETINSSGGGLQILSVGGGSGFISGTDVYVAGTQSQNNSNDIPVYFKNNTIQLLPFTGIYAGVNSIFVSGTDVYAAGYQELIDGSLVPIYWKNSSIVALPLNNSSGGMATSIFVTRSDVLVSGVDGTSGVYWRNGVENTLSNNSSTNSILVSGTDVYIAGRDNGPCYWKNGTRIPLNTSGVTTYFVSSIFISGSDVYVVGTQTPSYPGTMTGVYWKNGSLIPLTPNSTANSIFVSGNDIYVAGYLNQQSLPVYWKNGAMVNLPTTNNFGYAYSVFVK